MVIFSIAQPITANLVIPAQAGIGPKKFTKNLASP